MFEVNGIELGSLMSHVDHQGIGPSTTMDILGNKFEMSRDGVTPSGLANTFTTGLTIDAKPAGIKLVGAWPSSSSINIKGNQRFYCHGDMYSIISENGSKSNMEIVGNTFGDVDGNIVTQRAPGISPIRLMDSDGSNNLVALNTLVGLFNEDNSSFLITSNFLNTRYCQNTLENFIGDGGFSTGFYFTGSNMGTNINSNDLAMGHDLYIDQGVIGPQFRKGNDFNNFTALGFGTFIDFRGTCSCGTDMIMANRFDVQSPQPSVAFPADVFPGTGWFFETPGSISAGCFAMLTPIEPIDLLIAEAGFSGFGVGAADVWTSESYLYDKLQEHPELQNENTNLQTWQPSGNVVNVWQASELIFSSEMDGSAVELQNQIKEVVEQISEAEDEELAGIYDQYNQLMGSMSNIKDEIDVQQNSNLEEARSILQSISSTSIIENTHKKVLLLYIQHMLDGKVFSTAELTYLQTIAEDCIENVGFIVNVAKGLLPECYEYQPCQYLPSVVEDNGLDNVYVESRSRQSNILDLRVYPNPTSSELYIDYSLENVASYEIFNAEGISVESRLRPSQQNLKLNLPAGIYSLVLTLDNGLKESTRFVVVEN